LINFKNSFKENSAVNLQ